MTRPSIALFWGLAALVALTGCGSADATITPSAQPVYPQLVTDPSIRVIPDLEYATADGQPLLLDACLPEATDDQQPRAAIVVIHGGSWEHGDKANLSWRSVCQWFASEGYVAVSVNYRLAPTAVFPAQLEDVQAAVAWLRDPFQVARFDIDPDRIGAFGGSAGGNLAALLGTSGSGEWTIGSRVAAVAEFSGPVDIRAAIPTTDSYNRDFGEVQLEYLGCTSFDDCAAADAASPVTQVDPTDPPFFVAHSTEEFIPLSQSQELVATLRGERVDTTFITVDGSLHSIAMLDADMERRVAAFFAAKLAG
jgi:acetyl esterase/lipase